jgi:hypothetical protein
MNWKLSYQAHIALLVLKAGCKDRITLCPKSIHVSESQHGGKVPTFELQETIKTWLIFIKIEPQLFITNIFVGLVLRVGSIFLEVRTKLRPNLASKKCRRVGMHPCHTWDLGLGSHVKW